MGPEDGYRLIREAFEELNIPWFIGGSIASSYHGVPRATLDVDIIAVVALDDADGLARLIGPAFYADPDLIREAIRDGRAFNLIHASSAYKFDIFPMQRDEFHQVQFSRRLQTDLTAVGLSGASSFVATAEDILLEKLIWYRQGDYVSERQWSDILSILRIQNRNLDYAYLDRWAPQLHVEALLARARNEAGLA